MSLGDIADRPSIARVRVDHRAFQAKAFDVVFQGADGGIACRTGTQAGEQPLAKRDPHRKGNEHAGKHQPPVAYLYISVK